MRTVFATISILLLFVLNSLGQKKSFLQTKRDSAKALIANSSSVRDQVNMTNIMLKQYYTREPDSTLYFANKALELSISDDFEFGRITSLSNIAMAKTRKGETEEGLQIARDILKESYDIDNKPAQRNALFAICEIFYTTREIDSLIKYELLTVELSEEIDTKDDVLVAYNNLGIDYFMKGYYDLSLKYHLKSKKINDELPPNSERSYQVYTSIFQLYMILEDEEKAFFYAEKMYAIAKERESLGSLSFTQSLLGQSYYLKKDYDKSWEFLEKAEQNQLSREKPLNDVLSTIYFYQGKVLEKRDQPDLALEKYEKAITFDRASFGEDYRSDRDIALISAKINNGDLREVRKLSKATLEYAQKKNDLKLQMQAHLAIARADSVLGNYKVYAENYVLYTQLKDSLKSSETERAIAQMEIEYETELKGKTINLLENENEIKSAEAVRLWQLRNGLIIGTLLLVALLVLLYSRFLLKKRNLVIINSQKDSIEKKNQENELLVKEIHHRVKNNLQIILSLLNAQTNLLKDDNLALEVIQESQNRIKSLSLIHEDLYKSENFSKVNAQNYFETLTENIQKSFNNGSKKIEINSDIEEISLKMSLAVPLGLILNELLTNSFKYAFESASNGTIKIKFKKKPDSEYYSLVIHDNGIGLANHISVDSPDTFGLQLVQGLIGQMSGQFNIDSSEGTYVHILIKDEAA